MPVPKRPNLTCAISIVRSIRTVAKDAAKIGAYMAHHALFPDRVIVSPAQRARKAWEHISAFSALPPVDYDDRLYEGGPDAILDVIKETAPSIRSLLIIGHNPG